MKTLEEAIQSIEDRICGTYHEAFPNSELRKDPAESVEFLKYNLGALLSSKKEAVRTEAFEKILGLVLDSHPIGTNRGATDWYEYARKHSGISGDPENYARGQQIGGCIEDCETILIRLRESDSSGDTMSVEDLNNKYKGKYLYFNGDEDGSQYVLVKNIHRGKGRYFEVDGILISVDWQDDCISISHLSNCSFSDFYYFDDEEEPYTECSELDKALESQPMDTSLPSHVMDAKTVVGDVIEAFYCMLDTDFSEEAKELSELFRTTKPQ